MRATTIDSTKRPLPLQRGEMACLGLRGKIGRSNGFGHLIMGASKYGDTNNWGGIWQQRRKGYNQYTGPSPGSAGRYFVLMRTYRPPESRSAAQAIQRNKMQAAVAAWRELTPQQKQEYNTKASKKARTGYNLFIQRFLKSPGL